MSGEQNVFYCLQLEARAFIEESFFIFVLFALSQATIL